MERVNYYIGSSNKLNRWGGDTVAYDYAKLLGRIAEKMDTQAHFAELIGISSRSLSLKLNNKVGWKQNEITQACQVLEIQDAEIPQYFFSLKVQPT